ncbi:MAG: methionine--tRNA ligase, partial [Spirochaetaceae bacterium]|nr:methionine--tRNA ligase [Spirochaetaceae bacterium]
HADIYRWFNIDFDIFGRTTTPIQTEIVQGIFKKLDERGYIMERTIEQLHCDRCGRFLADRYVRGSCPHCGSPDARGDQCEACGKLLDPTDLKEPRCASCGCEPVLKSTKHLYLDLPKLKDLLESWLKDASVKGFWAHNALQMTQAWIKGGLRERAITRDLKWGIPVPKEGYENKVFYVWFDACIGYISITGNYGAEKTADWRRFVDDWWKNPAEVDLFQFIGKDNIPFHTVIFPSSLLGTGENWTMLHHMSSTEYLNYEGGKFSKSRGVGVFGTDVRDTGIDADLWRFYIFYNRPEKADALFTWKDFQEKVNGELIGNLGNLVNRTLSFVSRYYDGVVPSGNPEGGAFWERVREFEAAITEHLERAELRDAFRTIFELSSFANKTFQDGEPWKKRQEDPPAAAALIADLCRLVRDLAIMVHPYIPAAAERIASFFGPGGVSLAGSKAPASGGNRSDGPYESPSGAALSWADLGKPLEAPLRIRSEVLFSRLEDSLIQDLRVRYSGRSDGGSPAIKADSAPEGVPPRDPDGKPRWDIRVARIVKIERHPKADKLYIETLEIAGEERVIVSGLVPFYKEEELLGKHILLVYNLKPAKLRGVESRGMLLAASDKDEAGNERVEVLDAGDTPTGVRVALDGEEAGEAPQEIDIDSFSAVPMTVENYQVKAGGRLLTIQGKALQTRLIGSGEVH